MIGGMSLPNGTSWSVYTDPDTGVSSIVVSPAGLPGSTANEDKPTQYTPTPNHQIIPDVPPPPPPPPPPPDTSGLLPIEDTALGGWVLNFNGVRTTFSTANGISAPPIQDIAHDPNLNYGVGLTNSWGADNCTLLNVNALTGVDTGNMPTPYYMYWAPTARTMFPALPDPLVLGINDGDKQLSGLFSYPLFNVNGSYASIRYNYPRDVYLIGGYSPNTGAGLGTECIPTKVWDANSGQSTAINKLTGAALDCFGTPASLMGGYVPYVNNSQVYIDSWGLISAMSTEALEGSYDPLVLKLAPFYNFPNNNRQYWMLGIRNTLSSFCVFQLIGQTYVLRNYVWVDDIIPPENYGSTIPYEAYLSFRLERIAKLRNLPVYLAQPSSVCWSDNPGFDVPDVNSWYPNTIPISDIVQNNIKFRIELLEIIGGDDTNPLDTTYLDHTTSFYPQEKLYSLREVIDLTISPGYVYEIPELLDGLTDTSGKPKLVSRLVSDIITSRNLTEKLEKEINTAIPSFKVDHPTLHIGFGINIDPSKLLTFTDAKSILSNFPYEQNIDIPDYYFYSDSKTPLGWSLSNQTDINNSKGITSVTNLNSSIDNILYIGLFNNTVTSYPSYYDVNALKLVIYNNTSSTTLTGGVLAGTIGTNISLNSYTIYKFVIPASVLQDYSGEVYFEFGFYKDNVPCNFQNLLFRNLKSNNWVSFFRESLERKAILPRLYTSVSSTPQNKFYKILSDNSSTVVASPLSLGSYTNGSVNTLKIKLRYIGDNISSIKLTRTNPVGNNVNVTKGDYIIKVVGNTITETRPTAVVVNFTSSKVVDVEIEFRSNVKLANAIANVRSLIVQAGTASVTVTSNVI